MSVIRKAQSWIFTEVAVFGLLALANAAIFYGYNSSQAYEIFFETTLHFYLPVRIVALVVHALLAAKERWPRVEDVVYGGLLSYGYYLLHIKKVAASGLVRLFSSYYGKEPATLFRLFVRGTVSYMDWVLYIAAVCIGLVFLGWALWIVINLLACSPCRWYTRRSRTTAVVKAKEPVKDAAELPKETAPEVAGAQPEAEAASTGADDTASDASAAGIRKRTRQQ